MKNSRLPSSTLLPAFAVLLPAAVANQPPNGSQGPALRPDPVPVAEADPGLAGLAWADVDADGHLDLLAPRGVSGVALLRALGDGTFEDVTEVWGLHELHGVRQASFADIEGDGLPDLFVLDTKARLLSNVSGAFFDVTVDAALGDLGPVSGGFWYDYDGDGAPDLVLQLDGVFQLLRNAGGGLFEAVDLAGAGALVSDGSAVPIAGGSPTGGSGRETVTSGSATAAPGAPRTPGAGAGSAGGGSGLDASASESSVASTGSETASASFVCAGSLVDQTTQGCLLASSDPVLGRLYPLSQDFFVDSIGRVGVSTTSPQAPLHVSEADLGLAAAGILLQEDLVVEATDAILGVYSSPGAKWGSAIILGEVDSSTLVDKWAFTRQTTAGVGDSSLWVTYGPDTNYLANLNVLTLSPEGHVGIGTTTPSGPLRVQTSNPDVQAARIESTTGATDNLVLYHNGSGRALNASSNSGTAIDASGQIGLLVSGASYGVDASTDGGIAMRAINDSSTGGLGAYVFSESSGSALLVASNHPTNPFAAYFDGKVQVGDTGVFGIPLPAVEMDVGANGGGYLAVNNHYFDPVVEIGEESSEGGYVACRNVNGTITVDINQSSSDSGYMQLFKADGTPTISLVSDSGGFGRITTDVLQINGGADLVESFDTREEDVEPGTVLVIDPDAAGELTVSRDAYDPKVAGVVSGAGGVRAGLSMGQEGVASGDTPVALTGRVYVKASAENGPIRPGDRLTTAETAGHAMRATDLERAPGAVIGKAMTALDEGTGLVLVLVNLQ